MFRGALRNALAPRRWWLAKAPRRWWLPKCPLADGGDPFPAQWRHVQTPAGGGMSMAENRFRHIGFLYQPLPAAAYIFIDGVNLTYGKMLLVFIFGLVGLVAGVWWQGDWCRLAPWSPAMTLPLRRLSSSSIDE